MYKYAGMGLLGLFIVMIFPSSSEITQDGMNLYGAATIDVFDRDGNSVFTQTVHNQLFDQGEGYILDQTFRDLTTTTDETDNDQVGAICLSLNTLSSADEVTGAAGFVAANGRTTGSTLNCISTGGPLTTGNQPTTTNSTAIAKIGPLSFLAGPSGSSGVNWVGAETIGSIGICAANTASPPANVSGCVFPLFAVVDTSDVTLQDSETVEITYTFDLTSAGT